MDKSIFQTIVDERDYSATLSNICEQLEKYLKVNHINTMVLGISGGIDSTVVAAIANLIVQENPSMKLIGLSLPSSTNEGNENIVAKQVVEEFCDFETSEIYNISDKIETILGGLDVHNSSPLTIGNIKARFRMMMLYDKASKYKGIVLDTDNLSEHFLGFWTLHGDVGDYSPIGMLWKDEVYGLAEYLMTCPYFTKEQIKAIKDSYNLAPTDGNGVKEGGDMAQIAPGLTYFDVSKMLRYITGAVKLGNFDEDAYYAYFKEYSMENKINVLQRYKRSEFKRKHLPLRVTNDINFELYF